MKLLYIAIAVLGAFLAIWVFFVVPAERRHHERKLAVLQKQIEKRQATGSEGSSDPASGDDQAGASE